MFNKLDIALVECDNKNKITWQQNNIKRQDNLQIPKIIPENMRK